MAERFKAAALKAAEEQFLRGFESLFLRHLKERKKAHGS